MKYVHSVLVNSLVKLAKEKSVARLTDRFDMAITVDWDVKPQTKDNRKYEYPCSKKQSSPYEL